MLFGLGNNASTLASPSSSTISGSSTPVAPRSTTGSKQGPPFDPSDTTTLLSADYNNEPRGLSGYSSDATAGTHRRTANMKSEDGEELGEGRPPILNAMLAGGIGGTSGDMLMHSLDTVKTRQQGDPHMPPKYTSLGSTYYKILRQEGVRKGLYGGWLPALCGSFPGTVIFFGVYEYSKRQMVDYGIQPHIAYLSAGFVADLAASIVYVPSEVLKTRLQLQGRYNNPYFKSGYNYRGTVDAVRTIVRNEGYSALFHGYKATLYRDLPFQRCSLCFTSNSRSGLGNGETGGI